MKYQLFEKTLKKIKCSKKDIVMIHTDLTNLEGGSLIEKCKILQKNLDKYFDKTGTILIPSFSYSFCKTGIFIKENTKSEVGIFDEYIRLTKSFYRSDHPIFSFSCRGKYSSFFLSNSNSATGPGSIFEKLRTFDGKILFIGARFINSCTFLHYVEQINTVPYRYSKYFLSAKKMKYKFYEYYVRAKEKFHFFEYKRSSKIEKDLIKSKILKIYQANKIQFSICDARKLFSYVTKKLKKNCFYILDKKPKTY